MSVLRFQRLGSPSIQAAHLRIPPSEAFEDRLEGSGPGRR